MRVGLGSDSHRLVEGRKFILGGVTLPFDKGLLGHSDADALAHAVIDALLGAAAMGDIGRHFPDDDGRYAGISSLELLKDTGKMLERAGYEIVNIDTVIIAQSPRMAPYTGQMADNIAGALNISPSRVNVKAKTNEKMGFIGRGEGIEVRAVALIN